MSLWNRWNQTQQFSEGNGDSETEEKITDDNGLTNWCDFAGVPDDEGIGDSETEENIIDNSGLTN